MKDSKRSEGCCLGKSLLIAAFLGLISYALYTTNHPPKDIQLSKDDQPSKDIQFIKTHDEKIRNELMDDLEPSHEHIQEVTLVSDTATGEYDNGGDVGGNYHIYFHAYANNNPNYGIDGEISFPNASIGPFTFVQPNPYKEKDMSVWYVYGDIDDYDNPLWAWKHEEEVEDSDT